MVHDVGSNKRTVFPLSENTSAECRFCPSCRGKKGALESLTFSSKHAHHSQTEAINVMKLEMTSLVTECNHLI